MSEGPLEQIDLPRLEKQARSLTLTKLRFGHPSQRVIKTIESFGRFGIILDGKYENLHGWIFHSPHTKPCFTRIILSKYPHSNRALGSCTCGEPKPCTHLWILKLCDNRTGKGLITEYRIS